jgi:hypothetical protein
MLKVINHFKAICIHCLLYTVYATTSHDAHNSDAENFVYIWQNLLVGIPKEVQAQIGTVIATSYGQNCHAMPCQHKLALSLPHHMDRTAMPCLVSTNWHCHCHVIWTELPCHALSAQIGNVIATSYGKNCHAMPCQHKFYKTSLFSVF